MVAVHLDGDWIILDSRWLALVDDTDLRQAVPLFVLDEGVRKFEPNAMASERRAEAPGTVGF